MTINQDRTLYGIPSIGENSFVSISEMNRLANSSMDDNGADNQIESENETEKKDEVKPSPPKRKRLENDADPYTITHTEMTVSALKDIEIRGRLIRPIYTEKLIDMNKIKIPDLFNLEHASKISIIVSQSDAQMNKAILVEGNHRLATILNEEYASSGFYDFRVPVIMFEINDEDFNEAYTYCLDLKVCETAQELSRVNLEGIPPVVLDIAMQTHGNEERRSNGKFSLNDSVVFVLSYLQKIVSNKEIESMRSHPHKRSEFWRTLVEKSLVVPAGHSKMPMIPLYFLLMRPSTQKISLKKLEDDVFPTTHRLFITACSASLANDLAAATLFSKCPQINAVALGESLQKLTNKAKVEVKAVDEVKTEGTDFVLHDQVEDIEDGARCFFYQRLPKESIQKMIEKKLQIVIARPNGETVQEMHRWRAEHISLGNLHEAAYRGDGTTFPCALLGPGVIADDSDGCPDLIYETFEFSKAF